MRINVAIPEAYVSEAPLNAALESVTRLNEAMMANGSIPTFEEMLKDRGIKWRPEPPGQEHFDHGGIVMRRGWGDCDDLAPLQAASLRHTGEDPGAQAKVRKSGAKRWHAEVLRSDGSIDDPSKRAGMGQPQGVQGASLPLMYTAPSAIIGGVYTVRPAIAMRDMRGQVQARADLPWQWKEHLQDKPTPTDYAMTVLHTAPVAQTALVGALMGACMLGEAAGFADPEHINRMCAIADAIEGRDVRDIAEDYGVEHAMAGVEVVGSFFGKLAKGAKSLASVVPGGGLALKLATSPAGKKLVQFIPGVGPVASAALEYGPQALKLAQGRGKAGPPPGTPAAAAAAAAAAKGIPEASPMNPFPSVPAYARQGRICIPATWE